jgi:hypothetical protein
MEMLLYNLWAWGQIELADPSALQAYCDVTARAVKWPDGAPQRTFSRVTLE